MLNNLKMQDLGDTKKKLKLICTPVKHLDRVFWENSKMVLSHSLFLQEIAFYVFDRTHIYEISFLS